MSIFESLYRALNEAIEFETEVKRREENGRMKCCQNCIRCSPFAVVGASAYYCSAYRRFVVPSECCPLHTPNGGRRNEWMT